MLDIINNLFENAISLNSSDLYIDLLYGISCENLRCELEHIKSIGENYEIL